MTDAQLNLEAAKLCGTVCDEQDCKGCDAEFFTSRDDERGFLEVSRQGDPWSPATDIADAFRVVEAMRAKGCGVEIRDSDGWIVSFLAFGKCFNNGFSQDKSLPRAIVRAALDAVGAGKEGAGKEAMWVKS